MLKLLCYIQSFAQSYFLVSSTRPQNLGFSNDLKHHRGFNLATEPNNSNGTETEKKRFFCFFFHILRSMTGERAAAGLYEEAKKSCMVYDMLLLGKITVL